MRLFRADPAAPHHTRIPSALTSFVDEVYATLSRLFAYVAVLALFAALGTYLWKQLPEATAMAAPPAAGWGLAVRSAPAFAISKLDPRDKTETYEILRHPEGGRKDVFRWTDANGAPAAELEIYRPGGEAMGPAVTEIAGRLDPGGIRELEAAGIVDSKFGGVTLLRRARQDGSGACLGFLKQADAPDLRISGWTCQGASLPAQRAAIICMLNRLTLLAAGNDPRLAALFAHAELRRTDCVTSGPPALSADWVMGSENPLLRGAL
ncbi:MULTISPECIES: hypothetical protein [unclassified Bradyrhizobium]|uniref:hypothetical protein n=1 Tax=unclassified Bradyrhizobium TaxID=2631580 RepID=UPI001BA47F4E|nr:MULTISPECIES: hypothetical protein [unclassified Bradyrhizobium]MBR1207723.1 hypothetical protein [Bradyrhizobium sp. AUGA SZCCT0124]MBR1316262.1 hypothetical protein [Bradyrhizobium sp. AUGA SZCCT0051]MBR1344273.1 hypothetical protein [Bradyrhizobium sp. AUGA SZCCT0105]MBR1359284.1 hypothetical protein [Bradyrhizobium sp. AUGA SZCCT0045]